MTRKARICIDKLTKPSDWNEVNKVKDIIVKYLKYEDSLYTLTLLTNDSDHSEELENRILAASSLTKQTTVDLIRNISSLTTTERLNLLSIENDGAIEEGDLV